MVDRISEIVDYKALSDHYIIRDGFVFLPMTYPQNVFDAIVIRHPQDAVCFSPRLPYSTRNLDDHIALINDMKLEKAVIIANDIDFIKDCPSLKHLKIIPADDVGNGFDYSPLYDIPKVKSLNCATIYGKKEEFSTTIDYSRVKEVESLAVCSSGHLNYENITTARSLFLSCCKKHDLRDSFSSAELDTLFLVKCKIRSLEGIQNSQKMQCIYLYENRSLQDISALLKVKKTLRAVRIKNCPKIEDFSVLSELENLELLELSGNNELLNLSFLTKMKNLKTFIFNMNVKDGDLTPCLSLSYAYLKNNRKHYNLSNTDLPRNQYVHGNENIEEWRRVE